MTLVAVVIMVVNWKRRVPRSMMSETCLWVYFLSIPGLLAFLGGMWLFFYDPRKHLTLGLTLAGAGFLSVCASVVFNALTARAKRAAWPVVSARCIEQALQRHHSDGADFWLWRLVCELNFEGKTYRVIPKVRWSDAGQSESPFWSESKAQAFISKIVSPSDECKLRVNPQNPLEAEVLIEK